MANEITKVTDKNNVDHPLRDAAAQTALTGILNGQSIDSFGDVESALKDKVDWESNTRTGVHNLLENKATSKEASGTTYTVNNDKSISLSGTPSGNSSININSYTGAELKAMGRYLTLSGGISQKAYLILRLADWTMIIQSRANEEQTVDTSTLTDGTTYYVSGSVESSADISGKTFYPMLRLATDTDSTYAPYAKTNRELTEDVATISKEISAGTNITIVAGSYAKKKDNVLYLNGKIKNTVGETAANTNLISIASLGSYEDATIFAVGYDNSTTQPVLLNLSYYKSNQTLFVQCKTAIPQDHEIRFTAVMAL